MFAQGRLRAQTQLRTQWHMELLPLARAGGHGHRLLRVVVLCQAEIPIPSRGCLVWSFNYNCTATVVT